VKKKPVPGWRASREQAMQQTTANSMLHNPVSTQTRCLSVFMLLLTASSRLLQGSLGACRQHTQHTQMLDLPAWHVTASIS
jgi:hypothetical protein